MNRVLLPSAMTPLAMPVTTVPVSAARPPGVVASGATDTAWRSLVKTVTYRVFGSGLTAMLAFAAVMLFPPTDVVSGAKAAGLVGLLEVPTKLTLYFLHERLWALFPPTVR